jgi:hypothetical protein
MRQRVHTADLTQGEWKSQETRKPLRISLEVNNLAFILKLESKVYDILVRSFARFIADLSLSSIPFKVF